MNEFLRKFDTIWFVAPWSIFRNFLRIFHFFNSNLNFEFGPVLYRHKPKPDRFSPVWWTLLSTQSDLSLNWKIGYLTPQTIETVQFTPSIILKDGFADVAPYQRSYVAPHQTQGGKLDGAYSLRWSIGLYQKIITKIFFP